jgi:hypothetical protein
MIEYLDETFYLTCDLCSSEEELKAKSWKQAFKELRTLGWKTQVIRGERTHECSVCQEAN